MKKIYLIMTLVCMMMVSCKPDGGDGRHEGHVYVDLGLSVKWATCNVGATTPEGYGDYFAWGETATKDTYSSSNCPTFGLSISQLQSEGYIDSEGILTTQYDAATVNWGKKWRTPTYDEIKELRDNCEMDNVEVNGVPGKLFTSKTTGNTLFFPFTGNTGYKPGTGATEAYEVLGAGESTSLWASTRSEVSQYAGGYYITDWMTYLGESPRETGCVVRPVYCE